jgi:hypothetical protein
LLGTATWKTGTGAGNPQALLIGFASLEAVAETDLRSIRTIIMTQIDAVGNELFLTH